jgi:hypothetical protein
MGVLLMVVGAVLAVGGLVVSGVLNQRAERERDQAKEEERRATGRTGRYMYTEFGGPGPVWPFWLITYLGCVLFVIGLVMND